MRSSSPDRATHRWCHRAPGWTRKRRGECFRICDRPIDTVARWRVRVDVGEKAVEVRPPFRAPRLREGDEELLFSGEDLGWGHAGRACALSAIGRVGQLEPALVGDVLTQGELAVDVLISRRDVRIELPYQARGTLGEGLRDRGAPPVAQVSAAVELPSLVVEAVRELVAHH